MWWFSLPAHQVVRTGDVHPDASVARVGCVRWRGSGVWGRSVTWPRLDAIREEPIGTQGHQPTDGTGVVAHSLVTAVLPLQVCGEQHRFEKLMEYFRNEDSNIDFLVSSELWG